MMETFATRYCLCNPGVFQSTGAGVGWDPGLQDPFGAAGPDPPPEAPGSPHPFRFPTVSEQGFKG